MNWGKGFSPVSYFILLSDDFLEEVVKPSLRLNVQS